MLPNMVRPKLADVSAVAYLGIDSLGIPFGVVVCREDALVCTCSFAQTRTSNRDLTVQAAAPEVDGVGGAGMAGAWMFVRITGRALDPAITTISTADSPQHHQRSGGYKLHRRVFCV